MGTLDHPNVMGIHNFYEDNPKYYYMVLDFMVGGTLFDRIVKKVGVILFFNDVTGIFCSSGTYRRCRVLPGNSTQQLFACKKYYRSQDSAP